jgi:hypothetical protein
MVLKSTRHNWPKPPEINIILALLSMTRWRYYIHPPLHRVGSQRWPLFSLLPPPESSYYSSSYRPILSATGSRTV